MSKVAEDWSIDEVRAIVSIYFEMFRSQRAGIEPNKSENRRNLKPMLRNRSDAAIEFKNRNISAILAERGYPYLRGYLPATNAQKTTIENVINEWLRSNPGFWRSDDIAERLETIVGRHELQLVDRPPLQEGACMNSYASTVPLELRASRFTLPRLPRLAYGR